VQTVDVPLDPSDDSAHHPEVVDSLHEFKFTRLHTCKQLLCLHVRIWQHVNGVETNAVPAHLLDLEILLFLAFDREGLLQLLLAEDVVVALLFLGVVDDLFVEEEAATPDVDFGFLAEEPISENEGNLGVSPNVLAI